MSVCTALDPTCASSAPSQPSPGAFWASTELQDTGGQRVPPAHPARPHLNPGHGRLLHQEGDEDEAAQTLSPGQREDGVQVPARAADREVGG